MRIVFLSERYPPHIMGGYEIACAAVADGLCRRGHEVAVLTSDFGLNQPERGHGNIFRLLHYGFNAPRLIQLARREIADYKTVRKVVAQFKPDVIYAWSLLHLFPSLYFALRNAGLPIIFNIQDTWLPRHLAEAENLRSLWLKPGTSAIKNAGKMIVRKALQWLHPMWLRPLAAEDMPLENIVFCSHFRLAEHDQLGLPVGNARVIYNGIDTTVFAGTPRRREVGEGLKVVFVGRLVAEKGLHTVIEAIGLLHQRGCRHVTLSIAGVPSHPWDYAAKLKETVKAAGLENVVHFLGMVPNDALPEVYRQHHVLVFPSIVKEGLPMTLLEAMSCGLAVVGTTTGGSGEVLQNEVSGLTFSPGNATELADCLMRLMQDVALSQSCATGGQQLVHEMFAIEKAVGKTEEFLQEVCTRYARNSELQPRSSAVLGNIISHQ